jgi:phage terminase large subunit
MNVAQIKMPDKLVPVFEGEADTRGAYGGRGSGKTRTFAKMTAVRAYAWDQAGREGVILCTRQFMNSLAESSLEEIKAAIQSEPWLTPWFDIGEKYIRTRSGRISYAFSGLDRNIDSIKSKARILLNWTDEGEPVTDTAWTKLVPTLREEDSELWVTWNPEREQAATNKRFRNSTDPRTKIVEVNYRDNPWFPAILERARLKDLRERPDQYGHIWEGEFITVAEGAYYARWLHEARTQRRICRVAADPLMTVYAIWDIGGTGAKADAAAVWFVQFIGPEVRILDYYEAKGQPLATHVAWMRENGYGRAFCVLPHDGTTHDRVIDVTYEGALKSAGFDVMVVRNQGTGAAMQRVNAARRLFPQMYFDEARCANGLKRIGWYHPKIDKNTGADLGPDHDDSSHGADAFGLIAVVRPLLLSAPDEEEDYEMAEPDQVTGY